tara:strand:+ start:592 stop:900 length:309 start_codon:yes stop_codon:yes gene_type:complete
MDKPAWILVDAEKRAAKHPEALKIPSELLRSEVKPGSLVKLIFEIPNVRGERMWVQVTASKGKGKTKVLTGTVINVAVTPEMPGLGEEITFRPNNIIAIWNG